MRYRTREWTRRSAVSVLCATVAISCAIGLWTNASYAKSFSASQAAACSSKPPFTPTSAEDRAAASNSLRELREPSEHHEQAWFEDKLDAFEHVLGGLAVFFAVTFVFARSLPIQIFLGVVAAAGAAAALDSVGPLSASDWFIVICAGVVTTLGYNLIREFIDDYRKEPETWPQIGRSLVACSIPALVIVAVIAVVQALMESPSEFRERMRQQAEQDAADSGAALPRR